MDVDQCLSPDERYLLHNLKDHQAEFLGGRFEVGQGAEAGAETEMGNGLVWQAWLNVALREMRAWKGVAREEELVNGRGQG